MELDTTNPYNFDLLVNSELTLFAKWEAIVQNKATFDFNLPNVENEVRSFSEDSTLEAPDDKNWNGFVLDYWVDKKTNERVEFPIANLSGEIELLAKYKSAVGVYLCLPASWRDEGVYYRLYAGVGGDLSEYYFTIDNEIFFQ